MLRKCGRSLKVAIMYRHVQLLCNLGNEIQQKMMMVPVLVAVIVISAVSVATLAHIPFKQSNWVVICILVTAYVDTTLITLFSLGGMVAVNTTCKIFIKNLKLYDRGSISNLEKLWGAKFVASCSPFKVKFGGSNFIEKLTPLKCLNCAARLTIQILLCERRYV